MYWPPDGVFSIFLYLKLNTKTERQILIKADRPIRFFYLYKCEQTKQKMKLLKRYPYQFNYVTGKVEKIFPVM